MHVKPSTQCQVPVNIPLKAAIIIITFFTSGRDCRDLLYLASCLVCCQICGARLSYLPRKQLLGPKAQMLADASTIKPVCA